MSKCPNCAAAMTITVVGELQDKRLRCSYCTFEIDLPDSYSETEEHRSADGRSYFRKTITRSDGSSPLPESLLRALGADQIPRDAQSFTVTTKEEVRSSIEHGPGLSEEQLREIEKLLRSGASPGKRFEVVRSTPHDDTAPDPAALATKVYAWASIAATVLAVILFGEKGLFVAVCGLILGWGWRAWRRHHE